jgi:hypothetical protein
VMEAARSCLWGEGRWGASSDLFVLRSLAKRESAVWLCVSLLVSEGTVSPSAQGVVRRVASVCVRRVAK